MWRAWKFNLPIDDVEKNHSTLTSNITLIASGVLPASISNMRVEGFILTIHSA